MIEITATVEELVSLQSDISASIRQIVAQRGLYCRVQSKVVNVGGRQIRFTFPIADEAKEDDFIYF